MSEILTESFCERCGTRYTFESARPKVRLKGVKVLSRGLKNFVLSDDTTMDEAMAAARSEADRESTAHQLDAFHKTFNFCMSCRQYTCPNCWNEVEARCQSCAPLPEREIAAPAVSAPEFPGLVPLAGPASLAEPASNGANGQDHEHPTAPAPDLASEPAAKAADQTAGLLSRFRPGQNLDDELAAFERDQGQVPEATTTETAITEPEAVLEAGAAAEPPTLVEAEAGVEREAPAAVDVLVETEPAAAVEAVVETEPAAAVEAVVETEPAAAVEAVVESEAPAAVEAVVETEHAAAVEAEGPAVTDAAPEAQTPFEADGAAEADVSVEALPALEAETAAETPTAVAAESAPEAPEDLAALEPAPVEPALTEPAGVEPVVAAAEIQPEPIEATPAADAEPGTSPADVVAQPTWRITAPDLDTPTTGAPARPGEPTPTQPAVPSPEPQWPAKPEWPAPQASAGLPFLGRPAQPQGGVESLWAASNRELVTTPPPPGRTTSGIQPCISCGLSLSANARFCRRCGTLQGGG